MKFLLLQVAGFLLVLCATAWIKDEFTQEQTAKFVVVAFGMIAFGYFMRYAHTCDHVD